MQTSFDLGNRRFSSKKPIALIAGIETDVDVNYGSQWIDAKYVSPLQIVQWTMAAAPNHPAVWSAIESMTSKLYMLDSIEIKNGDPIHLTGPGPWTFAIYKAWGKEGLDWEYFRNYGPNPRLIGDMLILPTSGFAYDTFCNIRSGTTSSLGNFGSGETFNKLTIVQHLWYF